MRDQKSILTFAYKNHRGEVALRRVRGPELWFGTTSYYPDPQWLLTATDLERNVIRTFALNACVFNGRFAIALAKMPYDGIPDEETGVIACDAYLYSEAFRKAAEGNEGPIKSS